METVKIAAIIKESFPKLRKFNQGNATHWRIPCGRFRCKTQVCALSEIDMGTFKYRTTSVLPTGVSMPKDITEEWLRNEYIPALKKIVKTETRIADLY